jgi:hypothetical protein
MPNKSLRKRLKPLIRKTQPYKGIWVEPESRNDGLRRHAVAQRLNQRPVEYVDKRGAPKRATCGALPAPERHRWHALGRCIVEVPKP